jgi:hypothetical protein
MSQLKSETVRVAAKPLRKDAFHRAEVFERQRCRFKGVACDVPVMQVIERCRCDVANARDGEPRRRDKASYTTTLQLQSLS